jgi:hypothetical protein
MIYTGYFSSPASEGCFGLLGVREKSGRIYVTVLYPYYYNTCMIKIVKIKVFIGIIATNEFNSISIKCKIILKKGIYLPCRWSTPNQFTMFKTSYSLQPK